MTNTLNSKDVMLMIKEINVNLGCGDRPLKNFVNCDNTTWGFKNGEIVDFDINMKLDLEYTLPFKDNSVDIIVMSKVLGHIKNVKQLIKEIKRILKSDGICYVFKCNECDQIINKYNNNYKITKKYCKKINKIQAIKIYGIINYDYKGE